MTHIANRAEAPNWRLPLDPDGFGIVTPGCGDRTRMLFVDFDHGRALRIGGEASLCFACGPEGGVYHPTECEPGTSDIPVSMDDIAALVARWVTA